MSFLIHPHMFDTRHLHFGIAVQNNDDTTDSNFSRIIYSTNHISLNGLGVVMNLSGAKNEQHYNKMFLLFDPTLPANQTLVAQLHDIECKTINKYVDSVLGSARRCIHSLTDQLNSGCIKAYVNDHSGSNDVTASGANAIVNANRNQLMLKICGVWETNDECGITYKFIKC
jgi:hypothetical protein